MSSTRHFGPVQTALFAWLVLMSAVVACRQDRLTHSSAMNVSRVSDLYINAFGAPYDPPVVFVHGGPGFHSYDFELAAAQALADQGFYVVVYDQRGQGRSGNAPLEAFHYTGYADDLKDLIDSLRLDQPVLIGHSHGGPIAIAFEERYPGLARKIVLASAPVDFWAAMQGMMDNCDKTYQEAGDQEGLTNIAFVRDYLTNKYDLMTAEERVGLVATLFQYHGLQKCHLYSPKVETPEAKALRRLVYVTQPLTLPATAGMNAMPGFLTNENYIHQNRLEFVRQNRERFCGLYGDEDGLFTTETLAPIREALEGPEGTRRFSIVSGASHSIYLDQREAFFTTMRETCGF
jgi:proline iminopeptidase